MRHLTTKYEAIPHINDREITKKPIFTSFTGQKGPKRRFTHLNETFIRVRNHDMHLRTTIHPPWQVLTLILLPWRTRTTSKNVLVRLKSKKMKNPHLVKKTKSKMTPYFYLYGTKKKGQIHIFIQNPFNLPKSTLCVI